MSVGEMESKDDISARRFATVVGRLGSTVSKSTSRINTTNPTMRTLDVDVAVEVVVCEEL